MKVKLLLVFLFASIQVSAQSTTYFNNLYDYNGLGAQFSSSMISVSDTDYVIAGIHHDINSPIYYNWHLLFLKIDSFGNEKWYKVYGAIDNALDPSAYHSIVKKDNEYFLSGAVVDSVGFDFFIFKLSNSFDSLEFRQYLKTGRQQILSMRITNDGGFVVAGNSDYAAYVVKLDDTGSIQWEKTYGGFLGERFYSVEQQPWDNGYILGGYTYSFGNPDGDMFVVKLDNAGNTKWKKTYGLPTGFERCAIKPLQNEVGYIMTGFMSYPSPRDWDYYIAKLDTSGGIVWQTEFQADRKQMFLPGILELDDGSFVSIGEEVDSLTGKYYASISKFSSQGNINWKGVYPKYRTSHSEPYDIIQTVGGGFMVCGYSLDTAKAGTDFQDIWVLKVDSNGCEVAGCNNFLSIRDLTQNEDFLKVYPNPATGYVMVEVTKQHLNNFNVTFYDFSGKRVHSFQLEDTIKKVDTEAWNSGMYFYEVTSDGQRIQTGKLIVN